MGAQGTAVLDFGAFPGSSHTTVDVAATGVVAGSLVEAWIRPVATTDHSVDEHVVETIEVIGVYLSDDNIRIHGKNTNQVNAPLLQPSPMLVGEFNVGWVWN